MSGKPKSRFGQMLNDFEESLIAVLLGAMTVITFANVVARYIFNSNILWALESTVFLFAWLVLIGAAYCVKISAHLGVDVILNIASPPVRRILVLISVACCIAFSVLLLIGAWQYWLPFAGKNAWYEVNDIPMLGFLRFIEGPMNQGEAYEKLPRFIPYAALPLGLFLLTVRFVQVAWKVITGQLETISAGHEAEDLLEEVAAARANKEG